MVCKRWLANRQARKQKRLRNPLRKARLYPGMQNTPLVSHKAYLLRQAMLIHTRKGVTMMRKASLAISNSLPGKDVKVMKKAMFVGLIAICIATAMTGIAAAETSSSASVSFTVAPVLSVQGNSLSFGAVTPGTTEFDNQVLATVSANTPWMISMTADSANFVRSDGATIPASNITARPAGTTFAPAPLPLPPTPLSSVGESIPFAADMFLTIPWNISPSNAPFAATATVTVVPQP